MSGGKGDLSVLRIADSARTGDGAGRTLRLLAGGLVLLLIVAGLAYALRSRPSLVEVAAARAAVSGSSGPAVTADPRLTFQVEREIDYYEKQSRNLTTMITVLGGLVAAIMGIGAVFGALNTMYSAVSERGREIATLRALGFGSGSVVLSFLFEALFIAFVGGVLGCLAALPVNGLTTGTMNWQTFSHLAFAFKITPALLLWGIVFALAMGLIGGLPPAIRAARRPVASALREL